MNKIIKAAAIAVLTIMLVFAVSCDDSFSGSFNPLDDPIDPNLPTIIYADSTLPNGKVGQSYSGNVASAQLPSDAEPAVISYAIAFGSLPSGLTLSSAGIISGTPASGSAGTKSFTVRASAEGCNSKTAGFTITITAAGASEPFAGGTGTPKTAWYTANTSASAFTINDADDLAGLAQLVNGGNRFSNKTINLGANIDLDIYKTGTTFNSGYGWIPIGGLFYTEETFLGVFDGGGKTITNLSINHAKDYQGLFGLVGSGGMVKNLKLTNVNITGYKFVGGVAGSNSDPTDDGGTIQNCSVEGSIAGVWDVGGVAGENYGGIILNCSSSGECSGIDNGDANGEIGGIAGYNSGYITNCYSTNNCSGVLSTGGLVGINDNDGTIENCYASGNVISENCSGGLIGDFYVEGTVKNNVALNNIVYSFFSDDTLIGRVIAAADDNTDIVLQNNFANQNMTVKYNWNGTTGTGTNKPLVKGGATIDGADVTAGSSGGYNSQTWWSNTSPNGPGFAFGNTDDAPWKMSGGSSPLPILYWE